jgi:hypothetical protein
VVAVMIGVDPHKGSHTAVAIGTAEEPLGELRVRASAAQAERLLAWAAAWPERTWAIEGAAGLGQYVCRWLRSGVNAPFLGEFGASALGAQAACVVVGLDAASRPGARAFRLPGW